MKKSQLVLLAIAVAAVALIAVLGSGGGGSDDDGSNGSTAAPDTAPAGATTVSFAYSPEKEKLLVPLVKKFNALEHAGRRQARVRHRPRTSPPATRRRRSPPAA